MITILFSNGLTPFVGFGLGQADIDNATDDETIISLTAGARYNLNDKAYVIFILLKFMFLITWK